MVTNTFMSAIITVLLTRGIKAGDEVICSPMGCLVSTQPYLSAGLKIVWADIDPTTGTLSPESVKSKITSKTKAIVHNHYCGYVGYVEEINKIAKEYNLTVIDDGKTVDKNLKEISFDKDKLNHLLLPYVKKIKDVEVLTVDGNGRAYFKAKNRKYQILRLELKEENKW